MCLEPEQTHDDQLDRIVTEVKLIGFGRPSGAIEDPRRRRLSRPGRQRA
jgi:hypothetical protein